MQTHRWNKKRVMALVVIFLVFYTIFSSGYNTYSSDVIIKKTSPDKVWKFVSDFSKMRLLNPTILDFAITSDTHQHDVWKYSVLYTERLSHWPFWVNKAKAHFAVRKLTIQEGGQYIIDSEHHTCFLNGMYCLKSKGEFACSPYKSQDSYCVETVYYQCPPFLGAFCRREVEFQRRAIMQNLTFHFNKIK